MAWKDLSVAQRSQLINIFRRNGVVSLSDMRQMYDGFTSPPLEETTPGVQQLAPVYATGGPRRVNFEKFMDEVGNRGRYLDIPAIRQFEDSLISRGYKEPQRLAILGTSAQEMGREGAASRGVGGNGYLGYSAERMPTSYLDNTPEGRAKQITFLLNDLETTHQNNWLDGGSGGPRINSGQEGFNMFWNSEDAGEATRVLNKSNIRPAGREAAWNNRAEVAENMGRYLEELGKATQPNSGLYTKLNDADEKAFQRWYAAVAKANNLDVNPNDRRHAYDYRGFWKTASTKQRRAAQRPGWHGTDTYKWPTHETFSVESKYYNPDTMPGVGHWEGGTFVPGPWNMMVNAVPADDNGMRWEEAIHGNGGSIHIKPSHRGRLTELKKRTGKSEAELYNDGNPAHKKMVVFARNSRKWSHNHATGGNLFGLGGDDKGVQYFDFIQPASVSASIPAIETSEGKNIAKRLATKVANKELDMTNVPAKYRAYVEGEIKGARPVTAGMNKAGNTILNTVDTVTGFIPGPVGTINQAAHMGVDILNGDWKKAGASAAMAGALGFIGGGAGRLASKYAGKNKFLQKALDTVDDLSWNTNRQLEGSAKYSEAADALQSYGGNPDTDMLQQLRRVATGRYKGYVDTITGDRVEVPRAWELATRTPRFKEAYPNGVDYWHRGLHKPENGTQLNWKTNPSNYGNNGDIIFGANYDVAHEYTYPNYGGGKTMLLATPKGQIIDLGDFDGSHWTSLVRKENRPILERINQAITTARSEELPALNREGYKHFGTTLPGLGEQRFSSTDMIGDALSINRGLPYHGVLLRNVDDASRTGNEVIYNLFEGNYPKSVEESDMLFNLNSRMLNRRFGGPITRGLLKK